MKTIWKYPLPNSVNDLALPVGAEPLCVMVQDEKVMLWAIVDPDIMLVPCKISVVCTGVMLGWREQKKETYVGSVILKTDVLHVFFYQS